MKICKQTHYNTLMLEIKILGTLNIELKAQAEGGT